LAAVQEWQTIRQDSPSSFERTTNRHAARFFGWSEADRFATIWSEANREPTTSFQANREATTG